MNDQSNPAQLDEPNLDSTFSGALVGRYALRDIDALVDGKLEDQPLHESVTVVVEIV